VYELFYCEHVEEEDAEGRQTDTRTRRVEPVHLTSPYLSYLCGSDSVLNLTNFQLFLLLLFFFLFFIIFFLSL
jgi:hypothetical protein